MHTSKGKHMVGTLSFYAERNVITICKQRA